MVADGIREDKGDAGQRHTAAEEKPPPEAMMLMEQVVGRENLREALRRVESNKGAPGERVMESVTRFLAKRLRLKVNQEKSAVERPWKRKFLGYSMTKHYAPKLKVASESEKRLKAKLREIFRRGRGRRLRGVIAEVNEAITGWASYFRLSEVKGIFEELDQWIRRKLRCIMWRPWKRARTRAKKMISLGLSEERAWKSAMNGRGPWWNAGSSHMNACVPARMLRAQGLTSLLQMHQRFAHSS